MKKLLFLFTILLFASCTSTNKVKEYNGKYTYGHEVEIFTDEKTGQDYWLDGNVEELNNYMQKLMIDKNLQYPEVKIKIQGEDKGKATNGLAEDTDKVLEVKKWELVQ